VDGAARTRLDALAARLLDALAPPGTFSRPFVLGLSGLQGSGKSTLARRLAHAAQARDLRALALSLDDVYLTRAERLRLAREVHPLLATRGVPGTHDLDLLHATLDALANASPQRPAAVPRFDKGRDDRAPESEWPHVTSPPRLIVLEGWCLGVPPEPHAALVAPVNTLEREEDPDGRWRRWVNARLADDHAALWRRIDRLVLLAAPSFEVVERWRGEQEDALRRAAAPRAMDESTLRRFIAHYERLSRHALASLPARADIVVELDQARAAKAIHRRA
jgi:D-glycerate 3-kinase